MWHFMSGGEQIAVATLSISLLDMKSSVFLLGMGGLTTPTQVYCGGIWTCRGVSPIWWEQAGRSDLSCWQARPLPRG